MNTDPKRPLTEDIDRFEQKDRRGYESDALLPEDSDLDVVEDETLSETRFRTEESDQQPSDRRLPLSDEDPDSGRSETDLDADIHDRPRPGSTIGSGI